MMDLFDYAESMILKQRGMEKSADNNQTYLDYAREIAIAIAEKGDGTCNADQVGERLETEGITVGNWAGSIFKGDRWHFTGLRVRSSRKSNHGRELKVWELRR